MQHLQATKPSGEPTYSRTWACSTRPANLTESSSVRKTRSGSISHIALTASQSYHYNGFHVGSDARPRLWWTLDNVSDTSRTVLKAEACAKFPWFSFHQPIKGALYRDYPMSMFQFVDGHSAYLPVFFDLSLRYQQVISMPIPIPGFPNLHSASVTPGTSSKSLKSFDRTESMRCRSICFDRKDYQRGRMLSQS